MNIRILIRNVMKAVPDYLDELQYLRLHRIQNLTTDSERHGYPLTREKKLLAGVKLGRDDLRKAYRDLIRYHDMLARSNQQLFDYCQTLQNRLDTIYARYNDKYLHYGECPLCGEACQPDFTNDDDVESVDCVECHIQWFLHHEDETDPRDGEQPWRTYRISNVERVTI